MQGMGSGIFENSLLVYNLNKIWLLLGCQHKSESKELISTVLVEFNHNHKVIALPIPVINRQVVVPHT